MEKLKPEFDLGSTDMGGLGILRLAKVGGIAFIGIAKFWEIKDVEICLNMITRLIVIWIYRFVRALAWGYLN